MLKQIDGNSPPTDTSLSKREGAAGGAGDHVGCFSQARMAASMKAAQPALHLSLNSHFQPEGTGSPAGQKEIKGALGFAAYQPWGGLSSASEM